ncbi:MAG: pyridoxal phosphate-dependent aminotransferase [Chlorobi bacterium]|nr:pyridoxal phosphate-dependent aminotransferase [Chlorobiota bacterium]
MISTSERLNRLIASQTLEMSERSKELVAQGIDIINLSVGEPDFNTPDYVKEAAKKAIDENYSFYTPVAGYPELRDAVVQKFKQDNNLEFERNQVVISNGAKQALANVILSIINKYDEVIIPAPYWVTYAEIDKIAEAHNIFLPTTIENNFKVTPEQVEKAISYRTKAFLFSSPSNPAGSVYTRDELQKLAEVFAKYDNIYIISDEIYEHINFVGKHESISQFDFIKDRVIVINGVSKCYAMTGWRIGYIGAPVNVAKACEKLQGQYTSGASSISQKAAYAALTVKSDYTVKMNKIFKTRRDLIVEKMEQIPGLKYSIPQGAFYIFPDISSFFGKSYGNHKIYNAKDLCMYLLDEAHVSTVPGSAFGITNCIRISYAITKDRLEEAMERIKKAFVKLK